MYNPNYRLVICCSIVVLILISLNIFGGIDPRYNIVDLFETTPEDYINKRVLPALRWYNKEATNQKYTFRAPQLIVLTSSAIIASISMLKIFKRKNITILILSLVSTLSSGILVLYNPDKLWSKYSVTASSIHREMNMYKIKSDKYANLSDSAAFMEYVMFNENIFEAVANDEVEILTERKKTQ